MWCYCYWCRGWKKRRGPEMSNIFSSLPVVSFQIQRVNIPKLTLRPGIARFCRPEDTLTSVSDGISFYIHRRAVDFLQNLLNNSTLLEKEKVQGHAYFKVSGSFHLTIKTGANMTRPWYITSISFCSLVGGCQITAGFYLNFTTIHHSLKEKKNCK